MSLTFVSLSDTLKAIAMLVPISDEEIDPFTDAPFEENEFMRRMARLPARNCFQYSRSAHLLLNLLFAKYSEMKWYEVAGVSLVLQSDKAKEDARQILIECANSWSNYKAHFSKDREASAVLPPSPTNWSGQGTGRARSTEIRLDKQVLSSLLNKEKIPYNSDLLLAPYLGHMPLPKTRGSSLTLKSITSTENKYRFRGVFADALSYAMESISDKTDPGRYGKL